MTKLFVKNPSKMDFYTETVQDVRETAAGSKLMLAICAAV